MISRQLAGHADDFPERVFLSAGGERLSYAACRQAVERLAAELAALRGRRVGLFGRPEIPTVVRLLALDLLGGCPYLLPPELDASTVDRLTGILGLDTLLEGPDALTPRRSGGTVTPPGQVVLFTSGTTGVPKAVLHTWQGLAARVRSSASLEGSRWLLTYNLSAFAGLQVFLHALQNGGQLSCGTRTPASLARVARRDHVTHISGTPTFFRLLLTTSTAEDLAQIPLRQITLGGEAVDQLLLDSLRERFPGVPITHIYASTEMGACFSVHDGREGFPITYLEDGALPVRLRIVDGELQIASPHAMRGYLEDASAGEPQPYFATGDLVETRGDRVHFLGRRSERINVGGNKVYPLEVEGVIREVPGVRAVRVSGAASSLVGQIVRADLVAAPGADPTELKARVLAHCRERLAAYKIPRLLEVVEGLEVSSGGKLVRS